MDEDWGERWEQSEAARRELLRLRGLEPFDPHRGRIRVVGAYDIPYFPETYLLEVLIHQSPDLIDFGAWFPYKPPAWDDEWGVGLAHFYFDRDGQELIGSYLLRPRLEPTCRVGLLLHGFEEAGVLIGDTMHWIQETSPIPERLLRLIWIEDGAPFAGPEQALGEWQS